MEEESTLLMEDLDQEIQQLEKESAESGPDIRMADHIVEKIGACDKEARTLKNWMAKMMAQVDQVQQRRKRLLFALRATAEALAEELGKKTIDVPHGTIALRTRKAHLEVTDPDAVMAAGFERIPEPKPQVDKTQLNDYFDKTGEVVKGTELVEKQNTISVKTNVS